MRVISFILLFIFSILLMILIPIGTVLFSANATFLKPYHSEQYLADSGIYTDLKQLIRKNLVGEDDKSNKSALSKLQMILIGQGFDKIVTDEFVSLKLGLVQTSLWDYFTDKTDKLLSVPIPELSDVLLQFPSGKLAEHGDLISLLGLNVQKLENYKTIYMLYEKTLWLLKGLLFILLMLCILLTFLLKINGKWLGITLILGGSLTLLLWIPIWIWTYNFKLPVGMKDFNQGMAQLIAHIRHDFLQYLSIIALVILFIGILSFFIKRKKPTEYVHMDID